jgi:hypothetical protein
MEWIFFWKKNNRNGPVHNVVGLSPVMMENVLNVGIKNFDENPS